MSLSHLPRTGPIVSETITAKTTSYDEVVVVSYKDPASVSLGAKLVGDVAVATGVTFCVAPFLTVVDKAIVQSAAGSHTLLRSGMESVQAIVRQPLHYLKSPTFLLMWGVYAATYSTANSLKTISEHNEYSQTEIRQNTTHNSETKTAGFGKVGIFLGTTFVNSGASLVKDRAYARMFGTNSVVTIVPKMSYVFWIARDLSVVGSSFILPDIVSSHLAEKYGFEQKAAKSFSQFTLPVLTQFVAGPLHYMGLDLYNRNLASKSWGEAIVDRSCSLYRGFVPVVAARIARIAPGYGFGGVFNMQLRDSWREHVVQREIQAQKPMIQSSQTHDASNWDASLLTRRKHTVSALITSINVQ